MSEQLGGLGETVSVTDPQSGQACRADERRFARIVEPAAADLVVVEARHLANSRSPQQLHRETYQAYVQLRQAAEAAGIPANLLTVVSGYRSVATQRRLWADALRKYGSPEAARVWVAPPGHSAHHTGRTIDFQLGGRNSSANVRALRGTQAYRWLVCNAARFGFTPYAREPWHWEHNPPAAAPTGAAGQPAQGQPARPVPPSPPQPPAPPPPTRPGLSGWHWLGEQPPLRRRPSLTGDRQLRMPPFATLTGFARGSPALNAGQIEQVNRGAEFIARSWTSPSPITAVRVTGYIDRDEWQSNLGQLRANAVRDLIVQALMRLNPGLVSRLRWVSEDRGLSALAKVEIYLWAGPTPPPVPPLVRIPSPAEAARTVVPPGPETPEQRIQRILRTLPPPPPRRRSLSQMFRQRVDGALTSAMHRVGVPESLRGPIRAGVHAALERGAEALLDRVLGASELGPEAQEALKASVRAFFQVPIQ